MINSNTHKNAADRKTTLMFQPTEILHSQDSMFLSSQMASNGDAIKSHGRNDGEASVSVKLELCDQDIGQNESDNSCALPNSVELSETSDQMKIDYSSEDENIILKEDSKESKVVDHERGSDDEILAYGGERGGAVRDSDHTRKEGILYPVRGVINERRRGRPRGRKSGITANSSFENRRGINNPRRSSFGAVAFSTSKFDDTGRGVFVEKRKRGRPRGSRGSRGANSSFEMKSPNEICGSAIDYGSPEVGIMSSSGVPTYGTPPSVIKVGRGALRPGCKSYRGRASGPGRGYRMEYHDQTPSWEGDTGFVPVEYDSALSDLEMPGKKRGKPPVLTPPLPKRARGVRGRPRGRSRGRVRTSVDRSVDSDSSDFGTQRFETPEHGTSVFDPPDITESRSGSEVDTPVSERFTGKRRGGRRPRGAKTSASFDPEEASDSMSEERIVTCAICKETMNQAMFTYHKLRKHNNCTWREGIDTPLDLSDPRVVNALLKQALQKRKQLVCEKCGLSRSSLVGYQSHVTFCAKSEGERDALLETCPVCSRRMMPSSLKVHMGVHRQEERAKTVEKDEGTPQMEIDPGEGSSKSSGKTKRAAANRAVSLMQQVIRGEDIFIEKAGDSKISSSKDMFQLYEEKNKSPDEESNAENGTKEIVVSIYQIAAWVRTIHRYGKATCRNPGCSFKSSDKDELINHFKNCELRPIVNYLCKLCSFGCELEKDMQRHVKSSHMEQTNKSDEEFPIGSDDSEDMEEIDEDEETTKRDNSKKGTSDSKETTPAGKTPKYSKHVYFLSKQNLGRVVGLHAYITALNWTLDFQLDNYSHIPLYVDWRTRHIDWLHLSEKQAEPYLPKARISLKFSRVEIDSELYAPSSKENSSNQLPWLRLSLFESRVESKNQLDKTFTPGFITLFAGGPVWAQAWCPTSLFVDCHRNENERNMNHQVPVSQFLALSCNKDFDTYHSIGNNNKREKGLIQIWDFGPLTNEENEHVVAPSMSLGIAHEFGAIWALEWCPSGCYDEEEACDSDSGQLNGSDSKAQPNGGGKFLRRLGLLAAACGDGTIRIFSVPFPSELNAQEPLSDLQLDVEISENSDSERNANCDDVDVVYKQNETQTEINSSKEKLNDCDEIEIEESTLFPIKTEMKSSVRRKENRTVNDLSAFETPLSSRIIPSVISSPRHTSEIESESKTKKIKPYPIYKPSFVVTLVLDSTVDSIEDKNHWQCLRIAWSLLGKSHRVLAASFSNGMVALWDLNSASPLLRSLRKDSNGVESLLLRPYHVFVAHTNAITALALVSCGAEKREDTGDSYPRYLVTGARDRMLKIWDLQDTVAPVTTFPRGLISNVVWLTNWLSCAVCNDDGFTHGRSATKIQSLRQYGYKPCPLLLQNSPVMSVAHSDWLNGIAHGTYGGEACLLIAQQLLLSLESLKTLKTRRAMIFYSELIDFTAEREGNRNDKSENSQESVDLEFKDKTVECADDVLSEEEKEENIKKEHKSNDKTTEPNQNDNCDDQTPDLPRTYAEASKRYGLLFCDLAIDHETGKMPKEASLRLQHLEEMKNVPLNLYPLAAINRICWNPNLQSFIWLATGHQTGLVRVCRIQKTRSKLVEKFESRSARKVAEVYSKRVDCDG